MMPANTRSLLLVDDDIAFCQAMTWALRGHDFQVETAHDASAAMQSAKKNPPEFAVVDLKMPGESGLTLIPALKALNANMRILVLTGYASITTAVEAIKLGATHYLAKPVDAEDVIHALDKTRGDPTVNADRSKLSAADFEWEHLQKVLATNKGNISATARELNIDRRTLQRKFARRRLLLK
jgi:two-component system, response regulator RegA